TGLCVANSDSRQGGEERAGLLARVRMARAEAETGAERLRRLQGVTDAALARLDIEHLSRQLVARVRAALNADTATVLLVDDGGAHLVVHESDGLREDADPPLRVPIGRGFAGTIAATREPMIVEDVTRIELVSRFLRERVRSLLGVPLLLEDQVIGVVHVGTVELRRFTDDDVTLLRLVADRVALALQQARLHQSERRARAE